MANKLREAVTIRKCDNLNKENFWDACKEICPKVTEAFYTFIDTYKRELYNIPSQEGAIAKGAAIANGFKFHDLPLEMQMGIVFRFFNERCAYIKVVECDWFNPAVWIDAICATFMEAECRTGEYTILKR